MIVVAIDIGGTFTDLIAFDTKSQEFRQAKSLTTPGNLVQGIIDCLNKSGIAIADIAELIHGSTTAINTLIERKGAKTGLIVTRGTRDVYAIGRGNRPEAYNLFFKRHRPLVPRSLTREVNGRLLASGDVHEPLDAASVTDAISFLKAEGCEAVAVCLLHSYINPDHEKAVGAAVRAEMPDVYLSLSHEILREYREYERMSTTVVNAYIGPTVGGYVASLEKSLETVGFSGKLSIMRSNGGVMTPSVATSRPVAMMESGPVGGIIACARFGQILGLTDVISFDMGGTTAKASLVKDGQPTLAPGYYVGGYASGDPVMLPMIDVVEVGAGGGSIAWIDEIGALKVGPTSAGAAPGPICYGNGGTEPTITDANVVLGRLDADNFLGGSMKLAAEDARRGVERVIARPLGMDVIAAAKAIIDIAVSKMSLAVREVSVEKGYDPRDFALFASGGAGPLHVLAIARELYIPKVIVPLFPSHFSALGMLLADERHDFVRTFYADLKSLDFVRLRDVHAEMAGEASASLRYKDDTEVQTQLDIRYVGQEFTLSVPVDAAMLKNGDRTAIRAAFDALYEHRYQHSSPDEPVEVVNVRVAAVGKRAPLAFPSVEAGREAKPARRREVYLDDTTRSVMCPVYERESLPAGATFDGPAIVQEHGTTTVMFAGDVCTVAVTGELIITVGGLQ
ncbi:MAG: N-methylhydantoinase A/acetone carboxylase, beta subunit [Hyphomicrobiales bacterium]|nr:N-methylhydantoinase A/acetone carboxylase, beta subunit [Hyphomicrobiales bacterium]